jgi:hypothetical protein
MSSRWNSSIAARMTNRSRPAGVVVSICCHRHRLHRGGDRQANSALWRIALVRMGCDQPTKDYVARRTAEGKTKTEIMRCLKRYIAREVFAHLLTTTPGAVSG